MLLRLGNRDRLAAARLAGGGRGVDTRLQGGHQVHQLRRLLGRLQLDSLATLDLRLDDLHQRLAILVAVGGRVECAGHGLDELCGHLALGRFQLDLLGRDVQLTQGADLIRPVQGGEEHGVVERVQRGEDLAVANDDLADRRQALIGKDVLEQCERLAADPIRLEVISLLDEPCLALRLGRIDELLDLDRSNRLEGQLLQVLVGDHDVLVGGVLVALDRVAPRDDLVLDRAEDLHLDPGEVLGVEHVEAHAGARFSGQVELDRDGHEAELDGPFPHGARHGSPSGSRSLLATSGCRLYHRPANARPAAPPRAYRIRVRRAGYRSPRRASGRSACPASLHRR